MTKTKIWEIGGSFYTTEKGFKQAIEQYLKHNYSDKVEYRIFELSETLTIADYKRQVEADERDKGIRSVLGELTNEEKLEIELKAKFDNFIKVMDSLGIKDSNYKGATYICDDDRI
jgi:transcriptional regulator NrdR family protein